MVQTEEEGDPDSRRRLFTSSIALSHCARESGRICTLEAHPTASNVSIGRNTPTSKSAASTSRGNTFGHSGGIVTAAGATSSTAIVLVQTVSTSQDLISHQYQARRHGRHKKPQLLLSRRYSVRGGAIRLAPG